MQKLLGGVYKDDNCPITLKLSAETPISSLVSRRAVVCKVSLPSLRLCEGRVKLARRLHGNHRVYPNDAPVLFEALGPSLSGRSHPVMAWLGPVEYFQL